MPPVFMVLCEGHVLAAEIEKRVDERNRLVEMALAIGADPDMLLDPLQWQADEKVRAEERRVAEVAKMRAETAPDPVKLAAAEAERTRVKRVSIVSELGGLVRAAAEVKDLLARGPNPGEEELFARKVAGYDGSLGHAAKLRMNYEALVGPVLDGLPAVIKARHTVVKPHARVAANELRDVLRAKRLLRDRLSGIFEPPTAPFADAAFGMPAYAPPALFGTGLLAALDPTTLEDTLPTIESPSDHPTIVETALELGNDPVAIYNFVHDTIVTKPYYGLRKGALGVLTTGRGNDADQSALLVALLRAAGVPKRFEWGTVDLTLQQALDYAGTSAAAGASLALGTGDVPGTMLTSGSAYVGARIEHVWVRAFVPYSDYRGMAGSTGSALWVNLDPSIKRYEASEPVDLVGAVPFDFDAAGNRLAMDDSGALTSYTYNTLNQPLTLSDATGTTTFSHDADGNRTAKTSPEGTTTLAWNLDDRLVAIDPGEVRAEYDAAGIRSSHSVGGEDLRFLYDGLQVLRFVGALKEAAR